MYGVSSRDYYDDRIKIYEEITSGTTVTTYVAIAQKGELPAESDEARRIYKIVETVPVAGTVKTKYHFPVDGDKFSYARDNRASLTYTS